jgi:hypothetical protein
MRISTRQFALTAGAVAALALITLVWSCGGSGDAGSGDRPLMLRSYQVAPETGAELRSIINRVLSRGENEPPTGRAEIGPNGLLIVAAPEEMLGQIKRIIDEAGSVTVEAPPSVTITYWAVVGTASATTTWTPQLAALDRVLDTIASADGSTDFSLLEKIKTTSLSGARTSTRGRFVDIQHQEASVQDGNVVADVRLNVSNGNGGVLETQVNIPPGRLLVLSQVGYSTNRRTEDGPPQALYFVIRAEIGSGIESPE